MTSQNARFFVVLTSLIAFSCVSIAAVMGMRLNRTRAAFEQRVLESGTCIEPATSRGSL